MVAYLGVIDGETEGGEERLEGWVVVEEWDDVCEIGAGGIDHFYESDACLGLREG